MAFLSPRSKLFATLILSGFAASETVGAFPAPAQKMPVQFEIANEQILLVKRGRGKAGNRGKRGGYRNKARARAHHVRRLKMRTAGQYRMRSQRGARFAKRQRVARGNSHAVEAISNAVIFGSPMWNSSAMLPPRRSPEVRQTTQYDVAATETVQPVDTQRFSSEVVAQRALDCDSAGSVVSGYGFSDLVPKQCQGTEYVFEGVRDTQLYVVTLRAADGELLQVSKPGQPSAAAP